MKMVKTYGMVGMINQMNLHQNQEGIEMNIITYIYAALGIVLNHFMSLILEMRNKLVKMIKSNLRLSFGLNHVVLRFTLLSFGLNHVIERFTLLFISVNHVVGRFTLLFICVNHVVRRFTLLFISVNHVVGRFTLLFVGLNQMIYIEEQQKVVLNRLNYNRK